MDFKLIFALTTLAAAVTAAPLTDVRSALFCESWSPYGTNYASDESPYDYYCSASQDRRSLTLRIIGKERENTYRYLMMAAVDQDGNTMSGTYKLDTRLRSITCSDENQRVLKVSDDDINDVIATYTLPEDMDIGLDQVNCRFTVAQNLEQYYRDVTVDIFGKVQGGVVSEEKPVDEVQEVVEIDEPTVVSEEKPVDEVQEVVEIDEPTVDVQQSSLEVEEPLIDTNETDSAQNTTLTEEPEVAVTVSEVATTTTSPVTEPTVEISEDITEFEPTGTIDETEDLQTKFEQEEKIGHETKTDDKETNLVISSPDVPAETDEFKNEGEDEEPEYMVDEFGIRRMIIPEKEKKLIYKGVPTGYWCGDSGNTYVLAPGTDCQMFYQTIMKEEDNAEVFPLASFNCAPGTRFNTFKCTCTLYDGMVCPDPNPDFKTTTTKPEVSPIFDGTLDNTDSSNSTEF